MDRYLWAILLCVGIIVLWQLARQLARMVNRKTEEWYPVVDRVYARRAVMVLRGSIIILAAVFLLAIVFGVVVLACGRGCGGLGYWAARGLLLAAKIFGYGIVIFIVWLVMLGVGRLLFYLPEERRNRMRKLEEIRTRKELAAKHVESTKDEFQAELQRRKDNPLSSGKMRFDHGEGTMYGARGEELD